VAAQAVPECGRSFTSVVGEVAKWSTASSPLAHVTLKRLTGTGGTFMVTAKKVSAAVVVAFQRVQQ
jgi:hypothetical protein